jgi:DNA polymerase-3 subunit gamma/tau
LAASAAAFLRDGRPASRVLFARAARKLLGRFSPVLWEGDESKYAKVATLAAALNEELEEIESLSPVGEADASPALKKAADAVCAAALKLEAEGVADSTPISQVRRMAHWARLAPLGNRKLVLIENADRMQEGARNALLKILEEPPATTLLVLTTSRRGALMPTILSRLRPYEFVRRSTEVEREVLRRVFRADGTDGAHGAATVADYLAGFLPVTPAELDEAAAAFFGASDARSAAAAVVDKARKFEPRSLFPSFLEHLSRVIAAEIRRAKSPSAVTAAEQTSRALRDADVAVGIYNQAPLLALERLFPRLKQVREALR